METKFKDVAHLYAGCKINDARPGQENISTLYSVDIDGEWMLFDEQSKGCCNFRPEWNPNIKPLLRLFSGMTNEEVIEYFNLPVNAEITKKTPEKTYIEWDYKWKSPNPRLNLADGYSYSAVAIHYDTANLKDTPSKMLWLLQHGFDLFNLINNGEAIDSATVKTPEKQPQ